MADAEDLARLESGEADLTKCDFRQATFDGRDLSGRNFGGCLLNGLRAKDANFAECTFINASTNSMQVPGSNFTGANLRAQNFVRVNFENAILRNAVLAGKPFINCSFRGADLRGSDFKNANFMHDNVFDDAIVDENTDFAGAQITRAVARLPAFRYFEFRSGRLIRKTGTTSQLTTEAPVKSESIQEATRLGTIRKIGATLAANPEGLALQAKTIAGAIREQVEDLNSRKPNDPVGLQTHEEYVEFIKTVAGRLDALGQDIETSVQATPDEARKSYLDKATEEVGNLASDLGDWWNAHRKLVVDCGVRVGLLGITQAFLLSCGAPQTPAFIAGATLLGIKTISDEMRKK